MNFLPSIEQHLLLHANLAHHTPLVRPRHAHDTIQFGIAIHPDKDDFRISVAADMDMRGLMVVNIL